MTKTTHYLKVLAALVMLAAITALTMTAGAVPAEAKKKPINIQPLSLTGGWAQDDNFNTNTVAFYKDSNGVVHLEGAVKCTTPANGCGDIATLPAGSRPSKNVNVPIASFNGNTGALTITPDGKLGAFDPTAGDDNVEFFASLEGVTFRAVQ